MMQECGAKTSKPPWRVFGDDPAAAAAGLQTMLHERLVAMGVDFGGFTVAWMSEMGVAGCRQRVLLRRSGRKVHVTCDAPGDDAAFITDLMAKAARKHLDTRATRGRYVANVWQSLAPLLPHLPERPVLADHISPGWMEYVVYPQLLSDGLAEVVTPVQMRLGGGEVDALVDPQRRRSRKLAEAGSRAAALTCCPVAAMIMTSGHARSGMHIANLTKAVTRGSTTFRDGHYSPSVSLGGDVTWKDGRMRLPLTGMPETIRSILTTRPLGDIVGHSWLPEGRIRSHVEAKGGLEVEVDYDPVPLVPVLAAAGLTLDQVV